MSTSIRIKAYLFFAVFAVALLVQGALLFLQTETIRNQATFLSEVESRITDNLHQMQVATIQIQQWLTDISATRGQDGLDDGFDEAEKSAQLFRSAVQQLKQLDQSSGIDYPALLPVMENYYAAGKQMAEAYIQGGAAAGNKRMGQFDAAAEALYGRIDQISEQLQDDRAHQFALQQQEADTAQSMTMLFSAIYLILLALALVGLHVFILQPVRNMQEMTNNLAHGEGDLTQRLNTQGNHELAELGVSFNAFLQRTDDLVSQMMKSVIRLIPMANELAQTNENIEQASFGQRERSLQVADDIHQTQESANAVSNRILQISDSVRDSVKSLNEGRNVAQTTMEGMDQLSQEIGQMSNAIVKLREDSEKIESVIDVINSISEQTNLLALNAAIEAARAGEAGRGFAVVADEVRTLATRTKDSTIQVQEMIQSIQAGTRTASDTMEKGMASTQRSVEQVNTSAAMLSDITDTMTNIDQQAQEIGKEVNAQNSHFSSVSDSIGMMEEEFQKTLDHLETSLNFGKDLNNLSNKLQGLMSKFKVTDNSYSDATRSESRSGN